MCYSLPTVGSVSLVGGPGGILGATDSITGAMVALWDTNPNLVQAAPGGLWTGEIPEDILMLKEGPFAVIEHEGEEPEWTFEDDYTESTIIRIQIFAKGAAEVERIILIAKATFDHQTLILDEKRHMQLWRGEYNLDAEPVRAPDSTLIFSGMLEYEEWNIVN